jgi:hypothetical protein
LVANAETFAGKLMPLSAASAPKKQPPTRACKATPKQKPPKLGEKDRFVADGFPANTFYFNLTTRAEKVKANAVLIRLNQFTEPRSQLGILRLCQIAFKHAVLHPLSVRLEDLMELGATFVFRNVIANHYMHKAISALAVDICRFLPASTLPTVLPEAQTLPDRYIEFAAPDA